MNRLELIEKMRAAGKTVGMNREDFEAWMKGLDVYPQGRAALEDRLCPGNYCCLGVQQMVKMGKVESREAFEGDDPNNPVAAACPSDDYLIANGIVYLGSDGYDYGIPYIGKKGEHIASLNDRGVPFSEIKELLIEYAYLYDGQLTKMSSEDNSNV